MQSPFRNDSLRFNRILNIKKFTEILEITCLRLIESEDDELGHEFYKKNRCKYKKCQICFAIPFRMIPSTIPIHTRKKTNHISHISIDFPSLHINLNK